MGKFKILNDEQAAVQEKIDAKEKEKIHQRFLKERREKKKKTTKIITQPVRNMNGGLETIAPPPPIDDGLSYNPMYNDISVSEDGQTVVTPLSGKKTTKKTATKKTATKKTTTKKKPTVNLSKTEKIECRTIQSQYPQFGKTEQHRVLQELDRKDVRYALTAPVIPRAPILRISSVKHVGANRRRHLANNILTNVQFGEFKATPKTWFEICRDFLTPFFPKKDFTSDDGKTLVGSFTSRVSNFATFFLKEWLQPTTEEKKSPKALNKFIKRYPKVKQDLTRLLYQFGQSLKGQKLIKHCLEHGHKGSPNDDDNKLQIDAIQTLLSQANEEFKAMRPEHQTLYTNFSIEKGEFGKFQRSEDEKQQLTMMKYEGKIPKKKKTTKKKTSYAEQILDGEVYDPVRLAQEEKATNDKLKEIGYIY